MKKQTKSANQIKPVVVSDQFEHDFTRFGNKSSYALVTLDLLKEATHMVAGGTLYSHFTMETLQDKVLHMSHIWPLKRVSIKDCSKSEYTQLYKKYHYSVKGSPFGKLIRKKPNPYYINDDAVYVKFDYPISVHTTYFFIGYLEVLFDYDSSIAESHLDSVTNAIHWMSNLTEELFVPYAKYITAYPIAKFLKQEVMPPLPKDFPVHRTFLFEGKLKKVIKNRVNAYNDKNARFLCGILQGVKRACYLVPEVFRQASLRSHAEIISKESYFNKEIRRAKDVKESFFNEFAWGDIETDDLDYVYSEDYLELSSFHDEFKIKLEMLTQGFEDVLTPEFVHRRWVPSTSASIETKKAEGGQFGGIQQEFIIPPHRGYYIPNDIPSPGITIADVAESGLLRPDEISFMEAVGDNEYGKLAHLRYSTKVEKPKWAGELDTFIDQEKEDLVRETYASMDRLQHLAIHRSIPEELQVLYWHPETGELKDLRGMSVPMNLMALVIKELESQDSLRYEDNHYQTDTPDVPVEKYRSYRDFKPVDRVVDLAEPLKVRIITVGEELRYFACKPAQLSLLEQINKFPQFHLTTEPLTSFHFDKLIIQEISLMRKLKANLNFDMFVSGDYKAATDGLDIKFSNDALAPFFRKTFKAYPELRTYLKHITPALDAHIMLYPYGREGHEWMTKFLKEKGIPYQLVSDTHGKDFVRVVQNNGQLMGSPLSFPILCIVNLIAYWQSLEIYIQNVLAIKKFRILPEHLPVLINGDDISFRSNRVHYILWQEQIKLVSFKLSLGKNYIHNSLLTINSVLYKFTIKTGDTLYELSQQEKFDPVKYLERGDFPWTFQELGYMNPGLLTAQSKGTMRDKHRSLPLSDLYEIVVGGAIDKIRAHHRFIHYNLSSIEKMTDKGKFNLFIPVYLGGLGFRIFEEILEAELITFTTFQRRFASFLVTRINESLRWGEYPKKYMSALVQEKDELQGSPAAYTIYRGSKSLVLKGTDAYKYAGWNPDRKNSKYIDFPGYDKFMLHPLSVDQYGDIEKREIRYRLPSKSIMKDFNKSQTELEFDPSLKEMSILQLLTFPPQPQIAELIEENIPKGWEWVEPVGTEFKVDKSKPYQIDGIWYVDDSDFDFSNEYVPPEQIKPRMPPSWYAKRERLIDLRLEEEGVGTWMDF